MGVQVIAVDSVYNSIVGNNNFSEIYPILKENVDAEAFESWLDDWCADNPGTHWLSYRMFDAQMEESFEQIRMLCLSLILFVGVIGILNIINTVYSSIHTRVSEIGMQRAIGMSAKSLYKTFLWEGAYYGYFCVCYWCDGRIYLRDICGGGGYGPSSACRDPDSNNWRSCPCLYCSLPHCNGNPPALDWQNEYC